MAKVLVALIEFLCCLNRLIGVLLNFTRYSPRRVWLLVDKGNERWGSMVKI